MKTKAILLGILFFTVSEMTGQVWRSGDQQNTNKDFRESVREFNKYRELHPGERIPGEKQFRRMEWFMQNRMDANGEYPASTYLKEAKRIIHERTLKSEVKGNWSPLGPFLTPTSTQTGNRGGSGRIDCLGFHPTNPSVIYVGTPSGGLWKTEDAGLSWSCLTNDLPTLGISDIVIHPQHPETIYIATGTRDTWWETYSMGVMRSTNGGIDWEETGLNFDIIENRATTGLIMNPANPEMMLAATSVGIFRTLDGGITWSVVRTGNYKDIKFKPGDFSVIYATSFSFSSFGPCQLFKSTNSGESFSLVQNLGFPGSDVSRMVIGVTPANPQIVYLACSNSTNYGFYGVYRSTDSGNSWTHQSAGCTLNLFGWNANGMDQGGQAYYDLSLSVSLTDPDEIYVGGVNIWKSVNGGADWQLNAHWLGYGGVDYVHADIHELACNPIDSVLYAGCDGGIYRLQEGSTDWLDLSDGLNIYQTYRLGLYRTQDDLAVVSPQDNGTTLFENQNCTEILLAEACDNFFDYTNPVTMYFGGYGSGLIRSNDGGISHYSIQPPGEDSRVFLPPFLIHPSLPTTIYCAYKDAYISANQGDDWINLTNGLSGNSNFQVMKVAPSDPQYIYLSSYYDTWRSTDGGTTWTSIKNNLPSNINVTDIGISDANPNHIWATFGQFEEGMKVFHSHDGGLTWNNISGNLPNMPVNCVTPVESSNNALYVGTDFGIYYRDDGMETWMDYSDGLPNVIILEMEINPVNHKIKAATYGRGLWETDLYISPTSTYDFSDLVANIRVYPNPASAELNVSFTSRNPQGCKLQIYDITGKIVYQKILSPLQGHFQERVGIENLPDGIYLLRIEESSGESHQKKIVKI